MDAANAAPSRIRLLPEHLVNRIAAGEVIERPAAVAKELIENALDAGATRIIVKVAGGGIDRIEVIDTGHGMTAEELALAVQRHATSKLGDENLIRISTLGFRGEALPSIGAAARLEITSHPPGAETAWRVRVEGGVVSGPMPAAGAAGTRVVVSDLFFATPARRKFLKHKRTEGEHVEIAARRLALAFPDVAFTLEADGAPVFDLPRQDRADRVTALLGVETAGALLAVEGARDAITVAGFVCAPTITRATAAALALAVNGRPVADPTLRTAVRVAYRDVIAAGRYPVVALWLGLPAEEVDVNVHPAKTEVRFRDAGAVRAAVIGTIGRALATGAGTAQAPFAAPRPTLRFAQPPSRHRGLAGFGETPLPLISPPAARQAASPDDASWADTSSSHPLGAPVAQVLDTYIIAIAADDSLVLVDQHAAHERLTHEALAEDLRAGRVRTQPLLLPAVVDLPPADAARLIDAAEALAALGLEIESFGPGAVLVRALPAVLGTPEPAPLLRDLADELAEHGEAMALAARLDAVIARMACHGSIRAGRRLGVEEMSALLRRMESTPRAATCSHGRPTFLKLSRAEIERLFGRR